MSSTGLRTDLQCVVGQAKLRKVREVEDESRDALEPVILQVKDLRAVGSGGGKRAAGGDGAEVLVVVVVV